jgi:hypothetical protein
MRSSWASRRSTVDDRTEEEFVRQEAQEADRTMEVEPHDDRTQEFAPRREGRMRHDLRPDDQDAVDGLRGIADRIMLERFGDAFVIINDLYEIVREPVVDPVTQEILGDEHGFTLWVRTESGGFVEDYSRLSSRDVKDFLFRITTRLFAWEQEAASIRGDAMYAKAIWEQALAQGYQDARSLPGGRTVEDRTQHARRHAREDRFAGIFQTTLSWRADALVKSLSLLSQRLKDVLAA